jgi:hypothetical protein
MHPKQWGRSFWVFLVAAANNYSTNPLFDEVNKMRRFLMTVGYVLPCKNSCKPNYLRHLKEYPLADYLVNKDSVKLWLFNIYNLTIINQGRKPLSYSEFINKFNVPNPTQDIYITLINVVKEYPEQPSFDDLLTYKNFFVYTKDFLNVFHNWIDINPYLITRDSLMKWLLYSIDQCGQKGPITIENFTDEMEGGDRDKFKLPNLDLYSNKNLNLNMIALSSIAILLIGYKLRYLN